MSNKERLMDIVISSHLFTDFIKPHQWEIIVDYLALNGAEVRPRATWETVFVAGTTGGFNWYVHSCPNCNYTYKTVVPIGYKYCPDCGAKMIGG